MLWTGLIDGPRIAKPARDWHRGGPLTNQRKEARVMAAEYPTSELSEKNPDLALALAKGWQVVERSGHKWLAWPDCPGRPEHLVMKVSDWQPSACWNHGGPIIEAEDITTWPSGDGKGGWCALHPKSVGLGGFYDPQNGRVDVTERDGARGTSMLE